MITADRTAFVINPKSHRVARKGSWLATAAMTTPVHAEIFVDDFAALPEHVAAMAEAGVTTVFVEGGDGTVSALMSACTALKDRFVELPKFAIVSGGSTNLAYKTLGFRAQYLWTFKRRLSAILGGAPVKVDAQPALLVESPAFTSPEAGFVLSTGTISRAMSFVQREFHGQGHRGSLAVAEALVRFLVSPNTYLDNDSRPVLRGSHVSIQAGEFSLDAEHGFSIMTSLPRLSLGLHPFWGKETGGIEMTYATWPLPHFRRSLLEALLWQRPAHLKRGGLSSHRTDRVRLAAADPIMIDGEVFDVSQDGALSISLTEPFEFLR